MTYYVYNSMHNIIQYSKCPMLCICSNIVEFVIQFQDGGRDGLCGGPVRGGHDVVPGVPDDVPADLVYDDELRDPGDLVLLRQLSVKPSQIDATYISLNEC